MSAAQSALANLSLQTENFDDAIRRFEELKRNSETGSLNRFDRWQLITAYVARDRWPLAKRELATILNDTKNPPSDDERVRGANIYRQHKEDAAALAQLDYVLKVNPTNPGAVVTRSYIFLSAKKYDESAQILRRAIELASGQEGQAGGRLLPDAGGGGERDAAGAVQDPAGPRRAGTGAGGPAPVDRAAPGRVPPSDARRAIPGRRWP